MHSSRMRTGRTLTVFRGRTPPENLEEPPKKRHPPKFGGTPQKDPPKIWRNPPKKDTPPKFGGTPKKDTPPKRHPPKKDTPKKDTPLTRPDTPPVDRQTLVKILPWPNFVLAGNKCFESSTMAALKRMVKMVIDLLHF